MRRLITPIGPLDDLRTTRIRVWLDLKTRFENSEFFASYSLTQDRKLRTPHSATFLLSIDAGFVAVFRGHVTLLLSTRDGSRITVRWAKN
jgi:hypothetical protein